jgi:tetratricopeptide (TPR) repeat protein
MDVFSANTDNLFITSSQYDAQKETFAQRSLSTGLDQFTSKNYELAITSFQRAIRMAPTSDTALNAYDYMARSQLSQGNTQAAIDTYTKALKIAPNRDDLHMQLGKIYTTAGRYSDAQAEYALAVKYNPSAANRYALGQGYLGNGQYNDAIQQFQQVQQDDPKHAFGFFGLGQTYAKQGNQDKAIESFQNALNVQGNYLEAYSEMGYAYVDNGQADKAKEIIRTLNTLSPTDTTLATNLGQYIYEQVKPKMTSAYVPELYNPFISSFGPGTKISGMSAYLADAGSERTFAMTFQFDKPMNQTSVENVYNWSIQRASGTGRADGYNYDMTVPTTEVSIATTPLAVQYSQTDQTATVIFKIRQNDTATGTIDPSHINFSFNGKDAVGLTMDKSADMYSGFSGFA